MRSLVCFALLIVVALGACSRSGSGSGSGSGGVERKEETPLARDYEAARRSFRTKLVRVEPSPQEWERVALSPDAREIEFESAEHKLKAWLSKGSQSTVRAPAVLFLHGGFAFAAEDWDMTKPFRDAGFVVLMPILRGENGLPGAFSLFYNEVDDVLAAADALAKQPEVDTSRIYVIGHSVGGVLSMLGAMTSDRFRAMASLSGTPDAEAFADERQLVPFDSWDANEFRMRSPIAFAASFKCPGRLYYGSEEVGLDALTKETAHRARAAGLDIEAVEVAGDHFAMTTPAIALAIAFFEKHR